MKKLVAVITILLATMLLTACSKPKLGNPSASSATPVPTSTPIPTATPVPTTVGDYQYILLEDETAMITRYMGKAIELTIPSEVDGHRVTALGKNAFYGFPTSISIPDSVISIGTNPFHSCLYLTSIFVSPDHPTLAIIDGVLFEKSTKTLICHPSSYNTKGYTVPPGIQKIGAYAFSNCSSLTSISIPDSVTSIGAYAFFNCSSLTSISIPGSVPSIGEEAFAYCSSLTSITLPDSVVSIGDYAFHYCHSLTSVSIPANVSSIGEGAFSSCFSLTSVTIPASVTSISEGAFADCPNVTFTVPRNSFAAQWCQDNSLRYTYPDANDWLLD